jgi:putative endonuclease
VKQSFSNLVNLSCIAHISALTDATLRSNIVCVSIDSRQERGAASEQLAAEYVQTQGLVVLARNLRYKAGELDLVCLDGDVLTVVEVRQRERADFGGPLGSVNRRKQRKIIRATRIMLHREPQWRGYQVRFDVVGLEGLPDRSHRIVWIKDAFRAT